MSTNLNPAPSTDATAQPATGTALNPPIASPSQAPAPAATPASSGHQSLWRGILSAVGGGPTVQYKVDPSSGQVQSTPVPQTKGQLFRNLFAGMLTGLAAGAEYHGPGAGLTSFGRGFEAETSRNRQSDERNRTRAIQDFEVKQKTQHDNEQMDIEQQKLTLLKAADARDQLKSIADVQESKARTALIEQDVAKGNYDLAQRKVEDSQKQMDLYNARVQAGWEKIPGEPEFDTLAQAGAWATDYTRKHPDFNKDFKPQIAVDPSTNKIVVWQAPKATQLYKIKMPDGSTSTQELTPEQFVDVQGKLAEIRTRNSETAKNYADAEKVRREGAEAEDTKNALGELNKVGGDITKLSPGARLTLKVYNDKTMQADISALKSLRDQLNQLDPGKDKDQYDSLQTQIGELQESLARDLNLRKQLDGQKPGAATQNVAATQRTIDQQLASGVSADQIRQSIEKIQNPNDRKALLAYLDGKRPQAPATPATIPDKPGGVPIP
ncbi:MAG TPA: hypothetical protein VHU83_06625 [Bryobacteraceae bacterium]|jgi:hypothetical protein|nr:hypothetical protein [Bryobacteraceae bacterium]